MIIYRYIARNVVRGFFILALILVSLFAIILLIDELDDVGTGTYTIGLAIRYVLLHAPKLLLDFATFISLLGSIIALGGLAAHHELVAMESLRGTPREITLTVIATAAGLMLMVLLIAQFVIPLTLHTAHVEKTLATKNFGDFISDSGYWSQSKGKFLHVGSIEHGRVPKDIEIYEFSPQHKLIKILLAKHAEIISDEDWILHEVSIKKLVDQQLEIDAQDNYVWKSFLDATQLGVIVVKPEALSLTDLYLFVQGLKQRGEQSYRYELILWQRLLNPLAAAIMVLLGMRFVFGSQRHTSTGKRVTFGLLVGIAFYVFSQAVTHIGTIIKLAPSMIAIIPSATVLLLIAVLTQWKSIRQS